MPPKLMLLCDRKTHKNIKWQMQEKTYVHEMVYLVRHSRLQFRKKYISMFPFSYMQTCPNRVLLPRMTVVHPAYMLLCTNQGEICILCLLLPHITFVYAFFDVS